MALSPPRPSTRSAPPHRAAAGPLLLLVIGSVLLLAGCKSGEEGAGTQGEGDTGSQGGNQASAQGGDYLLYAPSGSTLTYLIDSSNNIAHQWPSQYDAGQSAFLQPDGSIVRPGSINDVDPDNRFVAAYREGHNTTFQVGGSLQRISKDGEVLWSFKYYGDDFAPHHVATVMPNGDLLMPVWRYFSEDQSLALGRDPKHLSSGGLWIDSLVEIRPTGTSGGEVVWEWRASDHLIQDFDSTKADFGKLAEHPERIDVNYGRGLNVPEDFMHVNSAFYVAELDQIVFTSYHYSELWVIDHSTTTEQAAGGTGGRYGHGGDLLYRWGNPWVYGHDDTGAFLLSAVHDPKWLANSRHFIMYDNDIADFGRKLKGGDSMVVEIEPPMAPDGSYELGADGVYGPAQPVLAADLGVQASSVGTAQRLADGRTLSCDCPNSEAIWLDAAGTVIGTAALSQNTVKDPDLTQVFRLVSYPKDDPGVQAALGQGGQQGGGEAP
jgi:Arylsulfotransferase (ASST)